MRTLSSAGGPCPPLAAILQPNPHFDPLAFPLLHLSAFAAVQHLLQPTPRLLFFPKLPLTSPAPSSISILQLLQSPPVFFFPLSTSRFSLFPPQRVLAPTRRPFQVNFLVESEPVGRFHSLSPSAEWLLRLCCVIFIFIF